MTRRWIASMLAVAALVASRPANGASSETSLLDASGYVADYGERERICDAPLSLVIPPSARGGNYAMCCKEISDDIPLLPNAPVEVVVRVRRPEDKLQVKIEDGGTHLFVYDGPIAAGDFTLRKSFPRAQVAPWHVRKVCVAQAGRTSANQIEVISAKLTGPGAANQLVATSTTARGSAAPPGAGRLVDDALIPTGLAIAGAIAALVAAMVLLRRWSRDRARPETAQAPRPVILFLAAQPKETSKLDLDFECAAIAREIRLGIRRNIIIQSRFAVTPEEMMHALREYQPAIVHFSGHGTAATAGGTRDPADPATRDVASSAEAAIQLVDEQGQPQTVRADALTEMIRITAPSVRTVVLNACFTEALAGNLLDAVPCVVGMRGEIDDGAARTFSIGLYGSLGDGSSVGTAVRAACALLRVKRASGRRLPDEPLPDDHRPVCRTRKDVDADKLVLS